MREANKANDLSEEYLDQPFQNSSHFWVSSSVKLALLLVEELLASISSSMFATMHSRSSVYIFRQNNDDDLQKPSRMSQSISSSMAWSGVLFCETDTYGGAFLSSAHASRARLDSMWATRCRTGTIERGGGDQTGRSLKIFSRPIQRRRSNRI